MILATSAVIAVVFAAGAFLMLKSDLFRVVIGMVLISNAASLTLMAAGLGGDVAPIYPLESPVSDPLVQAMTLTALVIGFAVTALLLSLAYRVYTSLETVDLDELSREEVRREEELERGEVSI